MKRWTRKDTKKWINSVVSRVDDINFYLNETNKWCISHNRTDEQCITYCSIMVILWVCHLRNEVISTREIFEILKFDNWAQLPDELYFFNEEYEDLELHQLLELVSKVSDLS